MINSRAPALPFRGTRDAGNLGAPVSLLRDRSFFFPAPPAEQSRNGRRTSDGATRDALANFLRGLFANSSGFPVRVPSLRMVTGKRDSPRTPPPRSTLYCPLAYVCIGDIERCSVAFIRGARDTVANFAYGEIQEIIAVTFLPPFDRVAHGMILLEI